MSLEVALDELDSDIAKWRGVADAIGEVHRALGNIYVGPVFPGLGLKFSEAYENVRQATATMTDLGSEKLDAAAHMLEIIHADYVNDDVNAARRYEGEWEYNG